MKALTFQNTTLTPIKTDSQIWLTSGELAKALNYADQSSVNKIYDRNADEFSDSMTALIPNPQMKNAKIRIFSLKGCHLIAMFARTKVAKEFRQWVLDILDKEVGQPTIQKTTTEDRKQLVQAVNLLVKRSDLDYPTVWQLVHQYLGVENAEQIQQSDIKTAIAYVHSLMLNAKKTIEPTDKQDKKMFEFFAKESKRLQDHYNHVVYLARCANVETPFFEMAENDTAFFSWLMKEVLKNQRFMLDFDPYGNFVLTAIAPQTMVATVEELPHFIKDKRQVEVKNMLDIIDVCHQKLKKLL